MSPAAEQTQRFYDDLRDRPRRVGLVLARVGEQIERVGIWLQDNAAELQWRRARAWRRWGE